MPPVFTVLIAARLQDGKRTRIKVKPKRIYNLLSVSCRQSVFSFNLQSAHGSLLLRRTLTVCRFTDKTRVAAPIKPAIEQPRQSIMKIKTKDRSLDSKKLNR